MISYFGIHMAHAIKIADREIGLNHPPYMIAEMSGNHNGDIGRAFALIEAAKDAGADAVKLQTYTADTITIDHDGPDFQIKGGLWNGRSLYELYEEAHTPWDWHERLFKKASDVGISIFSSPFDPTAVDFLTALDAPAFKIASFELVDIPLIEKVASVGKPMILSTGLADLGEIQEAIAAVRRAGLEDFVVLHCISSYPAPADNSNLLTMPHLGETFNVLTGLSDHTHGTSVSVAATALGATVIEKHMTLDRNDGGPDAAFSLEPNEFRQLVVDCNTAWKALGGINYELKDAEQGSLIFRRSLYIVKDIAAGEVITSEHVRSIRPGYGLPPKELESVLGQRARDSIARGTPLAWHHLV
ncbi:pseudaminic acid synthase [Pseudovibrio sp. Ad26]|uniref:pseudaminic acid synthase n=1 Tax=Pseudovibrio sp. Ad26 TaxID=989410 RepID=UPI0007B23167|nr:pseudaminic acid synthase [Pseudovibrio sp. Ad26]KZL05204.1 Pseudaminic acid synthase [Pseudovibrio sp. Ad26]